MNLIHAVTEMCDGCGFLVTWSLWPHCTHEENGGQEMAIKLSAFLTTACLLFAVEAGAITGNDWRRLDQSHQQGYVIGVVDAWRHLEAVASLDNKRPPGAALTIFTTLIECVSQKGMPYSQIYAIVEKYMENNPS